MKAFFAGLVTFGVLDFLYLRLGSHCVRRGRGGDAVDAGA